MQLSPDMQGLPLPTVVNAPTICIQIPVPNDPGHIAAFLGVLYDLTLWNSWQRDSAHTGRLAARVWKQIWIDLTSGPLANCPIPDNAGSSLEEDISMQIRISLDDPCIIQMWCIDHWENWYDPRVCGPIGSQPGSGTPQPQPQSCANYHAQLLANGAWIAPTVVNAGDTIEISAASGATNDGSFASIWNCPNGQTFFAGGCVGAGGPHGGDPAAAVDHMRLIVQIDGTFYDAYNTTITVPGGVVNSQVVFQVNDSTLDDNAGSMTFDVQICNNAPANWSHTMDFTTSNYGFNVNIGAGSSEPRGLWVAGLGWRGNPSNLAFPGLVQITSPAFVASGTVTQMIMSITNLGSGNVSYGMPDISGSDGSGAFVGAYANGLPVTTTGIFLNVETVDGGLSDYAGYLQSIEFRGTGVNPFTG